MRIAYREWRISWDSKTSEVVLYSTYKDFAWESGSETSDQLPEKLDKDHRLGALHGLHAVLDWDQSKFLRKPSSHGPIVFAQGAVDIHGRVRDHEDGVIRAEHMRILALRVVEIPYTSPTCLHQDNVYAVNKTIEGDRLAICHCSCFYRQLGGSGFPGGHGSFDPSVSPLITYRSFSLDELETLLIERYEVPRLPLGVGPWEPPWGRGSVPEVDDLGNRSKGS